MDVRPVVVVPHFNNHATVESVLQKCLQQTPALDILVVDDGSQPALRLSDEMQTEPRVHLLQLSPNRGKGVALRQGFSKAIELGFTHALVIDADGQHDPEDLPKFIAQMERTPFALISGVRDFEQAGIPGRSRFGRKNSNFWVWFHTGHHMADSQSGFRVYPLFGFDTLRCFSKRYAFEVEFAVRWLWRFKVAPETVSVAVTYSDATVSHFRKYVDNVRASWMHFRLAAETLFLPLWMIGELRKKLPQTDARPWSGKLRGGRLGHRCLKVMAHNIPRWSMEWVLRLFVVPYFLLAAPRARRSLREFREHLNPNRKSGFFARAVRDYRHFLSFASTLVDRLYASQGKLSVTEVDKSEAADTVHLFRKQNDGGIIVSAHFGCLDVVSRAYDAWEGLRKVHPMEYHARDGLSPAEVLGKTAWTTDLFDVRNRIQETSDLFCFLADRPVQTQVEMVRVLGAWVFIDEVPFRLAVMTGCPLLAMFSVKTGPTTYKTVSKRLDPLVEKVDRQAAKERMIAGYSAFLEEVVLRYPESWFNFYPYFSQLPWSPIGPLWPKIRGRVISSKGTKLTYGNELWKQGHRPREQRV